MKLSDFINETEFTESLINGEIVACYAKASEYQSNED